MRLLATALIVLAVLWALLVALAWRMQERIVWQPPRLAAFPGAGARRIDYAADDGQPLFAYLVGDPARAPGLVVACHGNADLAAWLVPWAEEVQRRTGWAVLVPEYRGYGGLAGSPDYRSSQRDARATYRLALGTLGVDSSRIVLFGHSLGSAIAAELAAEHPPAALVLVSPFTSARDMARAMLVLPVAALWGAIGRVHFDTRALVARLDAPVSVAHGDRDLVIPVRDGARGARGGEGAGGAARRPRRRAQRPRRGRGRRVLGVARPGAGARGVADGRRRAALDRGDARSGCVDLRKKLLARCRRSGASWTRARRARPFREATSHRSVTRDAGRGSESCPNTERIP